MQYRPLGRTGLNVSVISLGTMTWGEQNTEAEAHAQLDLALDAGVTLIDTAEMYPVPPTEATGGRTEQYIGTWLAKTGRRNDIVLASKAAGPGRTAARPSYTRGGRLAFNKQNLFEAVEGSLKRLQTDHLDLYQLHWPDRTVNNFGLLGYQHHPGEDTVPIEETLDALEALVKAGKIRHFGVSNETPWGVSRFVHQSELKKLPRVASIQNPYSLVNRVYEIGMSEISLREDVGLLAYSPLAFGTLSGKYMNGAKPAKARLTLYDRWSRYAGANAIAATEAYVTLFREHGIDPAQGALAFVNSRDFVTANIIGATTLEQLRSNLASIDVVLSAEVLKGIDDIHARFPNPAP
ncbi:MAG: NADP(H)-dependent aldo-keto reductase [Rhizobacter sp.]|nr:NADP(H)-dependent aldo-keto reductase [Rhizobacter sp.]